MEPRDTIAEFEQLRGLLHNPPDALQSELPDSFPYIQGLMEGVIEGIMEEAQVMSRTLGAVYAEYRLHYGDSREYVRIWKCIDIQPYQKETTAMLHRLNQKNIMNGKRWRT